MRSIIAPSSDSNATQIPHWKLSNTGTSYKVLMKHSALVDHLSLCNYCVSRWPFCFFPSNSSRSFSAIQFTNSSPIKVRLSWDLSVVSPPIHLSTSLGPQLYVQTLISLTSLSSMLKESQEKQNCSNHPYSHTGAYGMSVLITNQLDTQWLIQTTTSSIHMIKNTLQLQMQSKN